MEDEHEGVGRGHEIRDTEPKYVRRFGYALAAGIAFVLLLMGWLFSVLAPRASRTTSFAPSPQTALPPQPRLQVNAPMDLKRMREREDALLNSYGWADRSNGMARIPIERAMEIMAQRSSSTTLSSASGRKPGGKR